MSPRSGQSNHGSLHLFTAHQLHPTGTLNLGKLIEHGAMVRASCSHCGKGKEVDLAVLAEKVGTNFDRGAEDRGARSRRAVLRAHAAAYQTTLADAVS